MPHDLELAGAIHHCHAFRDYEEEAQILTAIAKWWSGVEEEGNFTMSCVLLSWDDDSVSAEVFYDEIDESTAKRIQAMTKRKDLTVDPERLEKN